MAWATLDALSDWTSVALHYPPLIVLVFAGVPIGIIVMTSATVPDRSIGSYAIVGASLLAVILGIHFLLALALPLVMTSVGAIGEGALIGGAAVALYKIRVIVGELLSYGARSAHAEQEEHTRAPQLHSESDLHADLQLDGSANQLLSMKDEHVRGE